MTADDGRWWEDAVFYQLYPRSFRDTDGDGVGDIRGVIERLDYLQWLGVDAIWLNPITVSPNADWGYDVADYCAVDPSLGTLADADELVRAAAERNIRIVLDIVPNHTSDQHPWFIEARASTSNAKRDWYVWADPAADGGPPNNWLSVFTGPAWTLDELSGQYYMHNFLAEQPDLNWWNPEVRSAFTDILRFWFDRGVAGFRIDVAHACIKDKELRSNPPADESDSSVVQLLGQRSVFNMERPEVHEVWREWRALADSYDPARVLVGETYVYDVDAMASYYGNDDELVLCFNIPFLHAAFDPEVLRETVERTEAALGSRHWPVYTMTNHDNSRYATRWCGGDRARARLALMLLLTLRGTPFLYYGDELALPDTELTQEQLRDPVGIRLWPYVVGRDPERTPMPWDGSPTRGFTTAAAPWLPYGPVDAGTVEGQTADAGSALHLTRDLIALRRTSADLRRGAYTPIDAPAGTWAYRRGDTTVVALNFTDAPVTVPGLAGAVRIGTDRSRDQQELPGELRLAPAEGVVIEVR